MVGQGVTFSRASGKRKFRKLALLSLGIASIGMLPFSIAAQAETIGQALASAYRNNPTIQAAYYGVQEASEAIAQARSAKLPNVSASANVQEQLSSVYAGTGPVRNSNAFSYNIGVNYRQVIYDAMRTENDIDAARASVRASVHSVDSAVQNIMLSTARAYMDVVFYTNLMRIRSDNVRFFEALHSAAKDRLSAGEGTKIDVAQAKSRLAGGKAGYSAAFNNLRASQATYEQLVGYAPKTLNAGYSFARRLPRNLDAALKLAQNQHPDILASRAQSDAHKYRADNALKSLAPTIALTGSLSHAGNLATSTSSLVSTVGLSLSFTLYDGGLGNSQARAANISRIRSELDTRATVNSVKASAIGAWTQLQAAVAQISAVNESIEAAEIVLNGVIVENQVGQATTLDVLNARNDLTTSREQMISAQRNRVVAGFSLLAASGQLTATKLGFASRKGDSKAYIKKIENDVWGNLGTDVKQ